MEKKQHKKIQKKRSSYKNLNSYDDELSLVLDLLIEAKQAETEMVKNLQKDLKKLQEALQPELLAFFCSNVLDKRKYIEFKYDCGNPSSNCNTKLKRIVKQFIKLVSQQQASILTSLLLVEYDMIATQTCASLAVSPEKYLMLNPQEKEALVKIPWCNDGKDFTERVKISTDLLERGIFSVLLEQMEKGYEPRQLSDALTKLVGSYAARGARLMRTETMGVYSKTTREIFLDNGVATVEIIGDAMCGGICEEYVDNVISLEDSIVGVDLPPYHPNCACSYCVRDYNSEIGQKKLKKD
jgi:hypothetical protein